MSKPDTGQPIPSTMKRSILRFIHGLVSPSIYRAIEFILSPCCDIEIASVTPTLVSTGVYNVKVTLTNPVSFLNKANGFINVNGSITGFTSSDGNVITISNVHTTAGSHQVNLLISMAATNSGAQNPAVSFTTNTVTVTF